MVSGGGTSELLLLADTFSPLYVCPDILASPFAYEWWSQSGYRTISLTVPESGDLTIGFAVFNQGDQIFAPGLFVDVPGSEREHFLGSPECVGVDATFQLMNSY